MTAQRVVGFICVLSFLFLPIFQGKLLADIKHRVRQGETLSKIAKRYGVSIDTIKKANNLTGTTLKTHQILVIPQIKNQRSLVQKKGSSEHTYYTVKKGDTLSSISKKTGCSIVELKKWNNLFSNRLKVGQRIVIAANAKGSPMSEEKIKENRSFALTEDEDLLDDELDDEDLDTEEEVKNEQHEYSILGKWRNPEERSLLVKVAKAFLGTPYRLGGNSVRGLDCSAFVKKIYELFDVQLPRSAKEQAFTGMPVNRNDLQEGDLIFFHTRRKYGHVGIYIGNGKFIHAASGKRFRQVKIDSLDEPYYSKRFAKAIRVKVLDTGWENTSLVNGSSRKGT
ncbi:MAG: LysM peptidoglycan-binding domain-containing protein [Syntrophales bacterium]|nr:LysM peptidoglycan-binding domain-containing protein [Syntrophales bacterium]